ncbi:hypothetical protein SAMN05421819_3839 [Bryocella elongata]|uniref:Uncharacterized protein n=1 Tax=Bryocella elongata TaxID=863522 RepID=A0A1H6BM72_9BACT|nr:hypothetical protein [Bryocella elongata]SEG61801.1 hypothetical protein SAMN05421819_3839 [Bryocella elongata]
MSAAAARQRSLPLAWPLGVSGVATALVAGFVCSPPSHKLHSWGQIVSLATAYVLLAAAVHAIAVWSVCRVREETETAHWPLILSLIWAAWIVVVWLPLLALLTAERSPWVSLIIPVTAIFAALLLRWRSERALPELELPPHKPEALSFALVMEDGRELWRALLPAAGAVVAFELGIVALVADHAWTSGCLFGIAALYPLHKLQSRRPNQGDPRNHARTSNRAATANSVVVWLLLVLALTPFMATYAEGVIAGMMHIDTHGRPIGAPHLGHGNSSGYVGLILVPPPVPHPIVAPTVAGASELPGKTQVIPFDGAYWYFKAPDADPGPAPHLMHGDPVKNRVLSTDRLPLVMEAHQKLGRPVAMSCCSSLRIDVTNADTVAGPISIEVILHETAVPGTGGRAKPSKAALGQLYLKTSLVSPMPLKRPPVEDSVSFTLPSYLRGRSVDEITVRILPARARSLAGPQVAIKDFALQR